MRLSTLIVLLFVLLPPLLSAIMNQLAKAKQKRMLEEQRRERVRAAGITLEPTAARPPSPPTPPAPPAADSLTEQRRRQIERLRQRRAEQSGAPAAKPPTARTPAGTSDRGGRSLADASPTRIATPRQARAPAPAPTPVAQPEPVRRTVPSRPPMPKPQRRDQKPSQVAEESSGRLRTAAADPRRRAEAQRVEKDRLVAETAMRLHSRPAAPRELPGTRARDRIARLLVRPGRDADLRQLIIAKELLDGPLSLRQGF